MNEMTILTAPNCYCADCGEYLSIEVVPGRVHHELPILKALHSVSAICKQSAKSSIVPTDLHFPLERLRFTAETLGRAI